MTEIETATRAARRAAVGLPVVELDAPAAVLLVDLASRTVVHANDVAEQLAPGVGLPAAMDAWSDAAVLRDLGGEELSDTDHPLSRLAGGRAVDGQAVTAARTSRLGTERAPLWVVGVPLQGDPLDGFGLVVFLPMRERAHAEAMAQALQADVHLRERALIATGVTFTIADAQAEDMPLLWVNPAFTAVTGYTSEEAVGRNCRFLQGPDTDPQVRQEIRDALTAGRSITTTIVNYRKDGSAFWNLVAINPVHDEDDVLTHFVGIQTDVTARVTAEADRERALAAERAARADAVRAQEQLGLLAEASSRLGATLDVEESLDRLMRLSVPTLADWTMVTVFGDGGEFTHVVGHHRDGRDEEVSTLTRAVRTGLSERSPMHQHYRGAAAWRVDDYRNAAVREGYVRDPALLRVSEKLGLGSVMFVPLPGHRKVVGSMIFARDESREPFSDQELGVAVDLGRRAGMTLENARLYQAEHHIAETLQRSLLPTLPQVPGLDIVGRYRAGEEIAEVGGDFYDVIPFPDGTLGVAVGDVLGHDLAAAAAMGHLRGLLRACAWETGEPLDGVPLGPRAWRRHDPAVVLQRLDHIAQGLQAVPLATLVYATLTPPDPGRGDGVWRLAYASAGHPPMLLRHPDGRVETLDAASGLILGVEPTVHRSATAELVPGSLLLAYTDGLVERRDRDILHGLDATRALLAGAAPDEPAELCDRLLLQNPTDDDTAVLALHVHDA